MMIAIAGNIGSGKTTLAKYLSDRYDFRYIPQRRLEFNFIDDFFHDIEGKFFPAQVSFLISKAIEIQEFYTNGKNVVVDRSLLEDIKVFARLWIENRKIDRKIVELYSLTADFVKNAVPSPDLYLFCQCPADVSLSRIARRPKRSFEKEYPPNHTSMLEKYYSELTFEVDIPRVEIDTTYYDFTQLHILESICNQIFDRLENRSIHGQLSLFEETRVEPRDIPGLTFYNFDDSNKPITFRRKQRIKEYIYLAAPFTQLATHKETKKPQTDDALGLFAGLQENAAYGTLPSHYRSKLNKIKKALETSCGLPVLLPHKDINDWGRTSYPTEYITPKIAEALKRAAAVVAIPGCSIGVHLELGMAIARGIPIVIFDAEDFPGSFFVKGFVGLSNIKYIRIKSLSGIPTHISSENISSFIWDLRGEIQGDK